MAKQQSSGAYIAKLTLTLLIIAAVCAGLLGAVNAVTKDKIAQRTAEKTQQSMQEVMPDAASFEAVDYTAADTTGLVTAANAALDASGNVIGYVIQTEPSGFGGVIQMVTGVDANGAVTGVSIIDMSETSGLGTNASKPDFKDQFLGTTGNLAVNKDGGTIDALTGATITSRAVTNGVNAAVACANSLG
jgi:electron transport complex protein RnfG